MASDGTTIVNLELVCSECGVETHVIPQVTIEKGENLWDSEALRQAVQARKWLLETSEGPRRLVGPLCLEKRRIRDCTPLPKLEEHPRCASCGTTKDIKYTYFAGNERGARTLRPHLVLSCVRCGFDWVRATVQDCSAKTYVDALEFVRDTVLVRARDAVCPYIDRVLQGDVHAVDAMTKTLEYIKGYIDQTISGFTAVIIDESHSTPKGDAPSCC